MFSADVRHQRYFYKEEKFMTNKNIKEDINLSTNAATVELPVRVKMLSYNNDPFEFTPSIDELGQIVLTPVSKYVEFIDANIDHTKEVDMSVIEKETIETTDGSVTTQETTIILKANILADSDNRDFSAMVDEIGQVIIYPDAKENLFVTVSFENSSNTVTEDLETIDYFGYKLVNKGDGWTVYDYTDELIAESLPCLSEAKILACTNELNILENITESVDDKNSNIDNNTNDSTTDSEESQEKTPTDAEVNSVSAKVIHEIVETLTNNFTDTYGALKCDSEEERDMCEQLLSSRYNILSEEYQGKYILQYSEKII